LAVAKILPLVPRTVRRVASPFLGGGAVEIAIANELHIPVKAYDLFDLLVNYWQVQLVCPGELADRLSALTPTKGEYERVKDILKSHWNKREGYDGKMSPLEAATYYYFNMQLSYGPGFLGWMSSIYENGRKYAATVAKVREFSAPLLSVEQGESVLTDNFMRVYLIVVNGEIRKIGGSQDKGGMKSTLRIYQTGGKGGRPSIRSFGVWYFLYHEVVDNKANVEFYMIYQPTFAAKVKGLFGYHDIAHASLNYKLMEECCERDYQSREGGGLPEWNMQEAAKDWPHDIKVAHARLTSKSTKRHTLRGRSEGKMQ